MAKKKENKEKLSSAEIEGFRAMLLAKRNELLSNVISMETETLRRENSDLSRLPIHMADLGTDNFDQEFTLGLMDGERKILEQVNEALERIENGEYGICQGSGKPISKARLEAIPWTKYCVEYAGKMEKGSVKNNIGYPGAGVDYGEDEQYENPDGPVRKEAI